MTVERSVDCGVFLQGYPLPAPWRAVMEESGMNNTTRIVYAGGNKFVLRIYDNHRDADIVALEHGILTELQHHSLPFSVPQPIANSEGATITVSDEGKLGALYHYIPGQRASADNAGHVEGLGRAAGMLSKAMRMLETASKPIYDPYYKCEDTHAAMTNERMRELAAEALFPTVRTEQLERLIQQRERLLALRASFEALPHQWIHGDIVFSNTLSSDDRIAAILDFEFCTIDIRVMELAVVLAEFPEENDERALERIALLCRGFGSAVKLNEEEAVLLPELIKLRMMDVFLHFAGRYETKLDEAAVWDKQIGRASFVCGWIDRNSEQLMALFRKFLL